MQIDAALYDHQTETGARTVIDVKATMEGGEEPLSVGFRNSDTLVTKVLVQTVERLGILR
jgi:hypothetical protein